MQITQYGLIFALACGSSYLALYQYDTHVEPPLLVSLFAWGVLVPSSANIEVASEGTRVAFSSQPAQGIALFMALISAFALVGAVFGKYPTPEMTPDDDSD